MEHIGIQGYSSVYAVLVDPGIFKANLEDIISIWEQKHERNDSAYTNLTLMTNNDT